MGREPSKVTSGAKGPESQAIAPDPLPAVADDPLVHGVQRLHDLNQEVKKDSSEQRVFHSRFRAYQMQITAPFDKIDPSTGRRTQIKGLVAKFKPEGPGPGIFRVGPCKVHLRDKKENCTDCHHEEVIESIERASAYTANGGNAVWDAEALREASIKAAEDHAVSVIRTAPPAVRSRLLKELGVDFAAFKDGTEVTSDTVQADS